jgi:hypothetical protein
MFVVDINFYPGILMDKQIKEGKDEEKIQSDAA